ncbi:MAG: hypothetical protein Q8L52_01230 [bacterium]|nr:hypothetical protein [bacterium]
MEGGFEKRRLSKAEKLRQAARDIDAKQARMDELIKHLDTLDFSDVGKVLEWCVAFEELSDTDVERTVGDTNKIVAKFAEHGYVPGMNTGAEYKEEDKENSAKYIIGQALDGLENAGFISRAIGQSSDDWKAKFVK